MGDAGIPGELPERVEIGMARAAVVDHGRGAPQQCCEHHVPHHPARSAEPEEAVAGTHIGMELHVLKVFEQHAPVAVYDGFGQAGGTRRVEDPQRMAEGYRSEGEIDPAWREIMPVYGFLRTGQGGDVGLIHQVRQQDGVPEGGQCPLQLANAVHAVESLAPVPVAVDGDEQYRFDLAEAVGNAAGTEIGRAGRPDGPD